MVGTSIVSTNSPGQLLRSFCKSEWLLELLQNPSNAQEAIKHPTPRGAGVSHIPLDN